MHLVSSFPDLTVCVGRKSRILHLQTGDSRNKSETVKPTGGVRAAMRIRLITIQPHANHEGTSAE